MMRRVRHAAGAWRAHSLVATLTVVGSGWVRVSLMPADRTRGATTMSVFGLAREAPPAPPEASA
jgi:hypothetical protein